MGLLLSLLSLVDPSTHREVGKQENNVNYSSPWTLLFLCFSCVRRRIEDTENNEPFGDVDVNSKFEIVMSESHQFTSADVRLIGLENANENESRLDVS